MKEKFRDFSKKIYSKFHSLSVRLPLLFVGSGLLIMLIVIPIVYFRFKGRMIDEYTRMAEGVTNLMAHAMDAEKVQEYMDRNFEMEEYLEVMERFRNLKDNYPDILYMYVYHFEPAGGRVIFDLDTEEGEGDAPGSLYEYDPEFLPYAEELSAGGQIPALTDHTKYGYLLTYLRPVFDASGTYQCHVCVDFSMDYLYEQDIKYIVGILGILSIAVAIILLVDVYVIRRSITGPLNKMSTYIKDFAYETEADRFRNVQTLEELNISTQDEIQDLYLEFMSVMKESLFYMTNLNRAKSDIQDKEEELDQISEKAFKDALTGVGNHAAYNKMAEQLAKEIAEGTAQFAIVMADVNNLKYVNDTFGHKAGDNYIRGCCTMICEVYKHSPVFRIGGDEFAVVLKNEDYASRLLRLTKVKEAFVGSYGQQGKEAWERYTASVGMAEFQEGDESVEQVQKRADVAMYEDKSAFKKKYGSYR